MAPPLFVATFEWLARSDRPAALGARLWAVTVAAAAGATGAHFVHPSWVGGAVAAVCVTLALPAATGTPHPRPWRSPSSRRSQASPTRPLSPGRSPPAPGCSTSLTVPPTTPRHSLPGLLRQWNDNPVAAGSPAVTTTDTSPVTLYWRPGCPYCAGLRRRLRQLGVRTTEVNIWNDAVAAAVVRTHAGGNETVPTVVIGGTAMVNPTGPAVLDAARRLAPDAVDPAGTLPPPPPSWPAAPVLVAWAVVAAAVAASVGLDASGHAGLSWTLDAVAGAAYLAVRALRRWTPRRQAPGR